MEFAVGLRVSARGLIWDITDVTWLGAQQLLQLRCVEGDLSGLEWGILHPAEQVDILHTDFRPERPGSLAAWRLYHQACLLDQILGPDELLASQPGRVEIEPYQLVPLMRALELPRVRLLLADGVGLGKTIEACLIICEMIARRRAHRVLVVSPAGPLLTQWQQELRQRFGLRFVAITDAAALREERRKLELGGNPFDSIALCLISLDFAKQERVLEEIERTAWDLAIIDEAHHCISTMGTDRDDTLRRKLAEVVAKISDGLLLLTATPHDGFDPHFASLIELLDPSLVDGRGGLAGLGYRRHVVRRLKSHIRNPLTGERLFRERRVVPVPVEVSDAAAEPVRIFHRALAALVAPRLRRAVHTKQYTDALAFVSLLKRSVSTISACTRTLETVAERYAQLRVNEAEVISLRRERARTLRAYRRQTLRFGTLDAAAEQDVNRLEAEDIATDLLSNGAEELATECRAGETVAALTRLIRLGTKAANHDPKLRALISEIAAIRASAPLANVLIYTEYADSQAVAVRALREAADIQGEVLAISGSDSERERTRAAERCAEEDGIILISTDSLAEGLNLQRRCCHLIHLDLPYNPNRLEQRNGRIDRYGQTAEPQIRYLYLAGTFEERLLLRLIAKYEKARASMTFMPDTLGVTADDAATGTGLVAGFSETPTMLFGDEPSPIRTLDQVGEESNAEAYWDLLHEIDRAFEGYERTAVRHGWLASQGLNADLGKIAAGGVASHSDRSFGCVDLLDFVTESLGSRTGRLHGDTIALQLPSDCTAGLAGLPGFDDQTGTLRITRECTQVRSKDGNSVGFLGCAHPLVNRAISRVRRSAGVDDVSDHRISAARTNDNSPPALLLTYDVMLHGARRIEFQRVIAILLSAAGPPEELPDPSEWLALAASDRAIALANVWRDHFQAWAPLRQPEADVLAVAATRRVTAAAMASRRERDASKGVYLGRWLDNRANAICGAPKPNIADLFGAPPDSPAWQSSGEPLDRLIAFAADTNNSMARRRDASNAVDLFRERCNECDEHGAMAEPVPRPIGMLMLVPMARAA